MMDTSESVANKAWVSVQPLDPSLCPSRTSSIMRHLDLGVVAQWLDD